MKIKMMSNENVLCVCKQQKQAFVFGLPHMICFATNQEQN